MVSHTKYHIWLIVHELQPGCFSKSTTQNMIFSVRYTKHEHYTKYH